MSSSGNVVKSSFIKLSDTNVRIIDPNALVAKRLEGFSGLYQEQTEEEQFGEGPVSEEAAMLDELTGDSEGNGEYGDGAGETPLPEELALSFEEQREAIIAEANAEAERILNEAKAGADAIKEQAKEEGYKDGQDLAFAELENAKAGLEEERQQLEASYQELVDSLEPQLVDAITDVYESVFGANLYARRDVMICLINKALMHAESLGEVIIFVSSEDYDNLMGMKASIFDRTNFKEEPEIIQRDDYPRGKAKIETPFGIIDCSIDTELKELSRALRLLSYDGRQ